jgi:pilus assembly protein CpaC
LLAAVQPRVALAQASAKPWVSRPKREVPALFSSASPELTFAGDEQVNPQSNSADPAGQAKGQPATAESGPNGSRGRRFPALSGPFATPKPTQKDLDEAAQYVGDIIDPEFTLELALGRGRLVILKGTPKRVQIVDESIANYTLVTPKEITIIGKKVGTTNLNIWFADPNDPDKEKILSYLVLVSPDPEAKDRLERIYKALEVEINNAFPNSIVQLTLVGDKVMVTGQARDIVEATNILRIVRAHVPDDSKLDERFETVLRTGYLRNQLGIENLNYIEGTNIINLLRIPGEQQVMLRVTVAEVNRSAARSIGVNFNATNDRGTQVIANTTGNIVGNFTNFGTLDPISSNLGLPTANLPIALDNGQIKLAINALRRLNYARSLAEPNLVALNGQTASFHAGGEFPVPFVTGFTAAGLQGVNFVPYGVSLNFTPFITDKDRVRLQIAAAVSTRDLSAGALISTTNVPGLNTRNFQTTVELREGQTLAVAGLIQNNLGAESSRIPGIGDLPVLNWLTGYQHNSAGEQELVILITPELVHPMEPNEVPALPGANLFEPSDLEFFVCGRMESRRDYDYRSPVMNDLARMRRYHRCEQIYIFGPHGHSETQEFVTEK